MTRTQAVGVLLVALGLVYALLYAAWVRKRRRHTSAAVAVAAPGAGETRPGDDVPGSTVRAEGTYVSTTTAASRHERVAVAGLGNRSRATMTVRRGAPDELVRYERQGESDVVIPTSRLLDVRRDRGMAGKFVGANRLLVLRWLADDEAIYETGFLPRFRTDLERLESALWWHQAGSSIAADDHAPEGPPSEGPQTEGPQPGAPQPVAPQPEGQPATDPRAEARPAVDTSAQTREGDPHS